MGRRLGPTATLQSATSRTIGSICVPNHCVRTWTTSVIVLIPSSEPRDVGRCRHKIQPLCGNSSCARSVWRDIFLSAGANMFHGRQAPCESEAQARFSRASNFPFPIESRPSSGVLLATASADSAYEDRRAHRGRITWARSLLKPPAGSSAACISVCPAVRWAGAGMHECRISTTVCISGRFRWRIRRGFLAIAPSARSGFLSLHWSFQVAQALHGRFLVEKASSTRV